MPKRPSAPAPGTPSSGAEPGLWASTMPELTDWLTRASYEDGSPLGAVQLQLRREGSVIRATLKIADQGGLKVSAIEKSPGDALLALDLLLSGDDVPWETDGYPLQGPRGKKK
jgi:hypothetical protein